MSTPPSSPLLSSQQIERLRELGEERTAAEGDILFDVGDERYPFLAIVEGEAAIEDAAGNEIIRHSASGFLGEMNLLSGQTVFLRAVARSPMRLIAIEREQLRALLFDDSDFSELVLTAFIRRREALQTQPGIGIEIIGPREGNETRRVVEFAKRLRVPFTRLDPEGAGKEEEEQEAPLVRLPGGLELHRPSNGELSRALGIGLELPPELDGRPARHRRRSGRARRRRLRRLRGSRHAPHREHRASADRPAPRAGSRTTSASPAASAGSS